jgi:hypothetical protein
MDVVSYRTTNLCFFLQNTCIDERIQTFLGGENAWLVKFGVWRGQFLGLFANCLMNKGFETTGQTMSQSKFLLLALYPPVSRRNQS